MQAGAVERVADLVRQPRRQGAGGGESLVLPGAPLELALRVTSSPDEHDRGRLAVGPARCAAECQRTVRVLPVRVRRLRLELDGLPLGRGEEGGANRRRALREEQLEDVDLGHLVPGVAREPLRLAVRDHHGPAGVEAEQDDVGRLLHVLEQALALDRAASGWPRARWRARDRDARPGPPCSSRAGWRGRSRRPGRSRGGWPRRRRDRRPASGRRCAGARRARGSSR